MAYLGQRTFASFEKKARGWGKLFEEDQEMYTDVGNWLRTDYYGKDLDKQLFHTTPKLENEKKLKSSLLENNRQLYYTLNRGTKFDENKGHYIGEGSTGDYVILIQKALNLIFKDDPTYEPLKVEKDFGEKTKAAVIKFQREFELIGGVNGVVGPETIEELDKRVLVLEVKIATEAETIGSKSEKIAYDIIKRHGSARNIGKDLDNGKFSFTTAENKALHTYNNSSEITGFTTLGFIINDIIKNQAYLEKFNKDAADFFIDIIASEELTNSELTELTEIRESIVDSTKAEYMMAIFSPDIVGTILFISLGTGGSSKLQSKIASFSPKFVEHSSKIWLSITTKGANVAGTQIPKYFTLGGKFYVNPNATKHMAEYVARFGPSHSAKLRSQLTLSSFKSSVDQISKQGNLVMGKMYKSGNWEIIFSEAQFKGGLTVIKHARMIK